MHSEARDWWNDVDDEVLACLTDGPKSAGEIAKRLALSESAVTSLLLLLASEGKLRVTRVQLAKTA
jgi:predicted ArsR family transcriptional regulator